MITTADVGKMTSNERITLLSEYCSKLVNAAEDASDSQRELMQAVVATDPSSTYARSCKEVYEEEVEKIRTLQGELSHMAAICTIVPLPKED